MRGAKVKRVQWMQVKAMRRACFAAATSRKARRERRARKSLAVEQNSCRAVYTTSASSTGWPCTKWASSLLLFASCAEQAGEPGREAAAAAAGTHLKHCTSTIAIGVCQVFSCVDIERVRLRELRKEGWVPAECTGERQPASDAGRCRLQAAHLDGQVHRLLRHLHAPPCEPRAARGRAPRYERAFRYVVHLPPVMVSKPDSAASTWSRVMFSVEPFVGSAASGRIPLQADSTSSRRGLTVL